MKHSADPTTKWKALTAISALVAIIAAASTGYFAWAFADTASDMRRLGVQCIPPSKLFDKDFDQIAAAAAMGRLDIVSLLLAIFGLSLVFASFIGIWLFRREVMAETKHIVERLVPDEVRANMQNRYPATKPANGGQVYTPSDIGYKSENEEAPDDAHAGPVGDHSPAPESDAGPSDGDGARLGD